jgi:hypothetical protein
MCQARLLRTGEISSRPYASGDLIGHRRTEETVEALHGLLDGPIEQQKSIWIESQKPHWSWGSSASIEYRADERWSQASSMASDKMR